MSKFWKELFDLNRSIAGEAIGACCYPWEFLQEIEEFILSAKLDFGQYRDLGNHRFVHKSVEMHASVNIEGPCIVGENTRLRQGAYLRKNVIIGKECVVGNSTEIKNSVLFDGVQVPHFNYVGDSILGHKAHLGAGAVTSNVKADRSDVVIAFREGIVTGRRKLGAMVGDCVEVGSNSVLNPGTIVGRNTVVYPLSSVRGVIAPDCIYKSKDDVVRRK